MSDWSYLDSWIREVYDSSWKDIVVYLYARLTESPEGREEASDYFDRVSECLDGDMTRQDIISKYKSVKPSESIRQTIEYLDVKQKVERRPTSIEECLAVIKEKNILSEFLGPKLKEMTNEKDEVTVMLLLVIAMSASYQLNVMGNLEAVPDLEWGEMFKFLERYMHTIESKPLSRRIEAIRVTVDIIHNCFMRCNPRNRDKLAENFVDVISWRIVNDYNDSQFTRECKEAYNRKLQDVPVRDIDLLGKTLNAFIRLCLDNENAIDYSDHVFQKCVLAVTRLCIGIMSYFNLGCPLACFLLQVDCNGQSFASLLNRMIPKFTGYERKLKCDIIQIVSRARELVKQIGIDTVVLDPFTKKYIREALGVNTWTIDAEYMRDSLAGNVYIPSMNLYFPSIRHYILDVFALFKADVARSLWEDICNCFTGGSSGGHLKNDCQNMERIENGFRFDDNLDPDNEKRTPLVILLVVDNENDEKINDIVFMESKSEDSKWILTVCDKSASSLPETGNFKFYFIDGKTRGNYTTLRNLKESFCKKFGGNAMEAMICCGEQTSDVDCEALKIDNDAHVRDMTDLADRLERKSLWVHSRDVSNTGISSLTSRQQEAVIASWYQKMTVIVGPPGTGKTRTMKTIALLHAANANGRRVLVCAHSNTALDQMLTAIASSDRRHTQHVLRFGTGATTRDAWKLTVEGELRAIINDIKESTNDPEVRKFCREIDPEEAENTTEMCERYSKLKSDLRDQKDRIDDLIQLDDQLKQLTNTGNLSRELIERSRIIGATISYMGDHLDMLDEMNISTILVEEAAKVVEAEVHTFILLNPQKLIMIGDQAQLGPVIKSDDARRDGRMNQSLFERVQRSCIDPIMLNQQGRARKEIADLYRDRYRCTGGEEIKDLQGVDIPRMPGMVHHPIQWIDVMGSSFEENEEEATQIRDFLLRAKNEKQWDIAKDVSVITPYNDQRIRLEQVLTEANCMPRDVATVDKFQGLENLVIVVSLVSNSPSDWFLELNRITVLLSRARSNLIIFGNKNGFMKGNWKEVVERFSKAHPSGKIEFD